MLFNTKKKGTSDPVPAKRSWFKKPGSEADITDVVVRDYTGSGAVSALDELEMVTVSSPETKDEPAAVEQDVTAPVATPAAAEAAPVDEPVRPSMFAKAEAPAPKAAKKVKRAKGDNTRPIKLLVGYLPDSSEKDTYYYMLGVAERNLDSDNIGWAGLFPFENGYAYEIQEGGNGRSYLESVLEHFRNLPPFLADEDLYVYIRTATRTVRVERTKTGLYSVLLPEGDARAESEFVSQGKKLSPLVEKRTGLFVAGVVLFLSGLLALTGAYVTRYQPYTPGVLKLDRVPANKLPHTQWGCLTSVPPNDYVTALRYEKGEWKVETNLTGKAGLPGCGKPKPVAKKPTDSAVTSATPASDGKTPAAAPGAASAPVPPLPAAPK